jgi:hypothetical protein
MQAVLQGTGTFAINKASTFIAKLTGAASGTELAGGPADP